MKIKKCKDHGYTLKKICDQCEKETMDAHYKFVKIKSLKKF